MGQSQSTPKKYGIFVGDPRPGESAILHNARKRVEDQRNPDDSLMLNRLIESVNKLQKQPFLGSRVPLPNGQFGAYSWKSYGEVYEIVTSLAQGMEAMKLFNSMVYEGMDLRLLGIYAKTREEWAMTDMACWMTSITSVPLYDTLGDESISWVFEQTELSTVFLAGQGISKLLAMKQRGLIKTLKCLVSFDPVDATTIANIETAGLQLVLFGDVMKRGRGEKQTLRAAKPDEVMTICYTSGTTARAKGVEITHRAFHDNAWGNLSCGVFEYYYAGMPYFSYLPLAHVFERVLTYVAIIGGFKIGYYHGDMLKITEDAALIAPEVLVAVPRIFCRLYEGIMSKIAKTTGFKGKLIQRALRVKHEAYAATGAIKHWLYDNFVFKPVRALLGGRIRLLVSSAAPLDAEILLRLKLIFSAFFIQGYGQSEVAGSICLAYSDDVMPCSLGPPTFGSYVKVVDVPEMNYFSTDVMEGTVTPRGELCVKGTVVLKRYFKDPENTKEVLDAEGWLHTGDIVLVGKQGQIRIIDRKKNIFKLQQGEYVAPEKIENVLAICRWITQIFVYGDSLQTYLVAVIVPNKEAVMEWARSKGLTSTYEELCKLPDLNQTILADITAISSKAKFAGFEMIKKLFLTPVQFTIENNSLTPTLKIKRPVAKQMYQAEIAQLYAEKLEDKKE